MSNLSIYMCGNLVTFTKWNTGNIIPSTNRVNLCDVSQVTFTPFMDGNTGTLTISGRGISKVEEKNVSEKDFDRVAEAWIKHNVKWD